MKKLINFTKLYEISKTLRFELKPIWDTLYNLEKNWVIQKDRQVQENYTKIKDYFDDLHREFVKQALQDAYLNYLEYFYSSYIELNKSPKNKKNKQLQRKFENASKDLRKELVKFFEFQWNKWKQEYSFLKKWWIAILNEKEILKLMWELYPEQKELFVKFDRFFTYFKNFNESRKNFYADDAIAGAIATRAIDENLITFIKNIQDFKNFKNNFTEFIKNELSQDEQEIFELDFYNNCLLQDWIDNYNRILWGYSLENWERIQWINEKINLFKQKHTHSNKKDIKFPKFKLLYKQILSKKAKQSFIEELNDDSEMIKFIKENIWRNKEKLNQARKLIEFFVSENETYELDKIYLGKQAINTLSSKYFSAWDYIRWYFGKWEILDFVSFADLKEVLESIPYEKIEDVFKYIYVKENIVFENKTLYQNFLNVFYYEFNKNINELIQCEQSLIPILSNFEKKKENIWIIKNYFDSVLSVYSMMKYFVLEKNRKKVEDKETDNNFYNELNDYYTDYEIWKDYNLVRNYLTKKKVKTDKFKLNFDNSQFLTGWDKDKEKERFWVILRKDWKYYLWILRNNKLFENYNYSWWDFYEKMNYKQLNNVYRQLPRLLFPLQKKLESLYWNELDKYLSKYVEKFCYNEDIADVKKEFDDFQASKEQWEKFDPKKLKKLINYYKNGLLFLYSDMYDLSDIKSREYDSLATFYQDIEEKMYSLNFSKIDSNFIDEKVQSWELYLFQIYNKDFAPGKKNWSRENIHTKYFKLLFDPKNLENLTIKLSGGAEVFFRDKTDNLNKVLDKSGKEVIQHKRYSQDKILFHISITLNANKWDKYQFNQMINEYLNKNEDIKIIWIDRWEKHLAYYSVIDKTWKIYEIDSLNIIKSSDWKETNYLEKLEVIEKSRKDARVSWWEIENIKELKNGYISQVVNKLADLIIKYNAIIVFEDLNIWFKRWRQKIEKQVYQKLELALAKKLNYLTYKDKELDQVGGYLNACQLVPKVNDYQDIAKYKQSWIMFYTRANYTSTTCPVCWFRKNVYISNSATKEKQKKFFENVAISFDGNKFVFDYEIVQEKKKKLSKTKFSINSSSNRLRFNTRKMEVEEIDITSWLKDLFEDIDLDRDITQQIFEKDSKFYKSLTIYFNLLLQLRNSDSKNNIDYIICPSCDYHSKNWLQWKVFNADANGAYNIARKWIMILDRIDANPEKPDLYISDDNWDKFAQG